MNGSRSLSWLTALAAVALVAGCSSSAPAEPAAQPEAPVSTIGPSATDEPEPGEGQSDDTPAQGSGSSGQSGSEDAGSSGSDSGTQQDGSSDPPPAPPAAPPAAEDPPADQPEDTPEEPAPPAPSGPAIAITTWSCNGSGDNEKLWVQLTANYNSKYRKGISWVKLTRPDNRGVGWISQTDAEWAGQYAGKGDRWSGELPTRTPSKDNYGHEREYGPTLKLRVRTDDGTIWENLYPIPRNC